MELIITLKFSMEQFLKLMGSDRDGNVLGVFFSKVDFQTAFTLRYFTCFFKNLFSNIWKCEEWLTFQYVSRVRVYCSVDCPLRGVLLDGCNPRPFALFYYVINDVRLIT